MEIEYLNSILYLQYNTIAEEAHSHPVCEGFFYFTVGFTIKFCVKWVLTNFHFWFNLCHKWAVNFLCLLTFQFEYNC